MSPVVCTDIVGTGLDLVSCADYDSTCIPLNDGTGC